MATEGRVARGSSPADLGATGSTRIGCINSDKAVMGGREKGRGRESKREEGERKGEGGRRERVS